MKCRLREVNLFVMASLKVMMKKGVDLSNFGKWCNLKITKLQKSCNSETTFTRVEQISKHTEDNWS